MIFDKYIIDKYIAEINKYWFRGSLDYERWFMSGNKYDSEIKDKFQDVLKQAEQGNLEHWSNTKEGFLAYIILLDQFSRQIYRESHKAYQNDIRAVEFTRTYLIKYINDLTAIQVLFVLMPFEHSENISDQQYGIKTLETLIKLENNKDELKILDNGLAYMKDHYKVLKKFGRFPKRNTVISGRNTTPEEQEYINSSKDLPY